MAVSRPRKLTHLVTILYEIDMLNFCYRKLREDKWKDRRDYYLCIEGFLLHYRNLIQFFGNDHDLKAGEPDVWSPKKLTEEELSSIQDRGPFKRHNGRISQYLSHCTKRRADRDVEWEDAAMYEEIRPLLENFGRLFPSRPRDKTWIAVGPGETVSTASISEYDSGLDSPTINPKGEPDKNGS